MTSFQQSPTVAKTNFIEAADAVIVMYSVTDRFSFHLAREILDWLAMETPFNGHYHGTNRKGDDGKAMRNYNSSSHSGFFPYNQYSWHPPITCPVLLLANKTDLSHIRKVRGLS